MATDIDTILTHRQRAANASRTRADYRGTYPYIRIPVDEFEALRDEIKRLRAEVERGRTLAQGLLDIAEIAMPASFFATDSRCALARSVLADDAATEG